MLLNSQQSLVCLDLRSSFAVFFTFTKPTRYSVNIYLCGIVLLFHIRSLSPPLSPPHPPFFWLTMRYSVALLDSSPFRNWWDKQEWKNMCLLPRMEDESCSPICFYSRKPKYLFSQFDHSNGL